MLVVAGLLALTAFRPPAVPLVTHSPYFSVWSISDKLTGDWSRHWTGSIQAMCGMMRIDGKTYRFMGPVAVGAPEMEQVSLSVTATRSTYVFRQSGVELQVEFMSPLLCDDLELLARPITYLTLSAKSLDGKPHMASTYVDWTGEWVVNEASQEVRAIQQATKELNMCSLRSKDQPVLAKSGDNLRIDWGALWLASSSAARVSSDKASRGTFVAKGELPAVEDTNFPRPANKDWPVVAMSSYMSIQGNGTLKTVYLIGYDEDRSITYMFKPLRPFWARNGKQMTQLLEEAAADYGAVRKKCVVFDGALAKEAAAVGGEQYSQLCALAYRQCLAGYGFAADEKGRLAIFPKENFSNGCISTVDVIFPASPFFVRFSNELLKAQLRPVLDYAASSRWKFPFAPHDLGTYPLANGQVYGGGERTEENQMPVEESGNMLLMVAAVCKRENSAAFAAGYWKTLKKWVNYLLDKGFDPENQLCTDDFAGHLAHNANLSIKAILALRAFADIAEMKGDKALAKELRATTQQWVGKWLERADDGDHYRLAFDKPGTWSLKYNLYWDKLLGLNLFPKAVVEKELTYYKTKLNEFGVPLDNRASYTKSDWVLWTASLARTAEELSTLVRPIYMFVDRSPSRVPFSDWHDTVTGKQVGFQARTVIGGIFAPLAAKGLQLPKRR